jgi:hypothetical protein
LEVEKLKKYLDPIRWLGILLGIFVCVPPVIVYPFSRIKGAIQRKPFRFLESRVAVAFELSYAIALWIVFVLYGVAVELLEGVFTPFFL